MKTPADPLQKAYGYYRYEQAGNLYDKEGKKPWVSPAAYAAGKVHDLERAVELLSKGSGRTMTPPPGAKRFGLIGFIQAFPEDWGRDQPFTQSELDADATVDLR